MTLKIISAVLILFSVYIGISHGSRVFSKPTETYLDMMAKLGITDMVRIGIGVCSIAAAILILFPATFLWVTYPG